MARTEIDIVNRALRKNHVNDLILSSEDGTLDQAIGDARALQIVREVYKESRQQVLRLAPWTCIQTRKLLASSYERTPGTQIAKGTLTVGRHTGVYSVYKCTTAGISGAGDVTWPATGTVTDGTAVWQFQYDVKAEPPETNLTGYLYGSPLPADYLNQVEVTDAFGKKIDFMLEGHILYTNTKDPVLIYTPDQENPDLWDPLLAEAICTQLASAIAYPITGDHGNEIAFAQASAQIVQQAVRQSAREKNQGAPMGAEWYPGLFKRTPGTKL